jgi:hypothetical protein
MEKDIVTEIESIMRRHFTTEDLYNQWMDKKNYYFGEKSPKEMIGEGNAYKVREFIRVALDK